MGIIRQSDALRREGSIFGGNPYGPETAANAAFSPGVSEKERKRKYRGEKRGKTNLKKGEKLTNRPIIGMII